MDPQRVIDQLSDLNPDAIMFEDMSAALVGLGYTGNNDPVAVYSKDKLFTQLFAAGMSAEDAEEYYVGRFLASCVGPNAPVIIDDSCEG